MIRKTHSKPVRPLVAVASLGGTITMTTSAAGGVRPELGAEDLLRGLAEQQDIGVRTATLATLPGASLDFDTLGSCYDWAAGQVAAGAAGVVVVQGTDTLEETAYFFEAVWPHQEPVIVTGAMRHPGLPGADGPANLLAALTVAAAPASRSRGCMLVMEDEVHLARWVRKTNSSRPDAFSSAPAGPVASVTEGAVHYFHPAGTRPPALERPRSRPGAARVPLLEATLDDSGELLDALVAAGAPGVVVAATGVGHVSGRLADAIERALPHLPVVVATRTGSGTTFRRTYGFRGSESDLLGMGVTMAGWLCPRKARILLCTLLAAGAEREWIEGEFRRRGDLG
ncbi:asparaginase [Streptomyces kronopolitis]|uniref:asparaginase n=1 Tax=Streptomyces kronopolitis TaxID=1612435 RepID=UPI00342AD5F3